MMTVPDRLVALYMPCDGIQDVLLHKLLWNQVCISLNPSSSLSCTSQTFSVTSFACRPKELCKTYSWRQSCANLTPECRTGRKILFSARKNIPLDCLEIWGQPLTAEPHLSSWASALCPAAAHWRSLVLLQPG